MTKDEANLIFRSWQEYMEVADKFRSLMLTPPASFLPYPLDTLEEALNIVAEDYFNAGDIKTAENIQNTMASLSAYFFAEGNRQMTDEEALEGMRKTLELILGDAALKETLLKKLKASQQSWIEMRRTGRPQANP